MVRTFLKKLKKTKSQKILTKRGGTQFGTFLKFDKFDKIHFAKEFSIDFDILIFDVLIFAYIE